MTRSAADSAAMLAAMTGRDLRDWAQGAGVLAPLGPVAEPLAGARIGYWSAPPSGVTAPEVQRGIAAALSLLTGLGATVEPVTLPGTDLLDLFHHHWFTGAAARLAAVPAERRGAIDPGFLQIAEQGAAIPVTALIAAQGRRADFGAAMDRLLTEYDYIISPATTIQAFGAGLEVPEDGGLRRWTEWAGFSYPINLSQQPAAVLRCGYTPEGLPIGLQIIGARGADARVLSAAHVLEVAIAETD
jgi:amidase/aspartyl-tRNA(Asn)/glutamyl-tRNA(Gln) amidotransferase subunit A